MDTLAKVVSQSAPTRLGTANTAKPSSATMITPRRAMPRSIAWARRAAEARPPGAPTALTLAGRPRDADDPAPGDDQQCDDREHERRRGAIRGDRGVRAQDRL